MNNNFNIGQYLTNLLEMTPEQKQRAMKPLVESLKSKGFLDDKGGEEVH